MVVLRIDWTLVVSAQRLVRALLMENGDRCVISY